MATIVVDLDGTVIDSTKRHYLLLKKLLQDSSLSTTFSAKGYLSYKRDGHSNYDFLTKKINIDPELANKIQTEWIANIESQEWIATDVLYPDAIKFLNNIKNSGHRIIFLTIRQNPKTLHYELKKLHLTSFPEQVIIAQKDKIAALHDIPYNQKLLVGDTEVDFNAAKNANIISFILNRGFRSPRFLHKLGINQTYKNLDEITPQILDICH